MAKKLEKDATIADVSETMKDGSHYVAETRHLMMKAEKTHGPVFVRIGITGVGYAPSIRLETDAGEFIQSFGGQTFQPFGDMATHDENWSEHRSSLAEVTELLRKMRNIKSKMV